MTQSATSDASDAADGPTSSSDGLVARSDERELRTAFVRQGAFLSIDRFLTPDTAASLAGSADALLPEVNRNYLPGHKKGGSVGRHVIDRLAPGIAALYRSRPLIDLLEQVSGEKLLPCPADDPHAYALYYYTRPGDHIGWHYDTSYYDGRRYTLLLGVTDRSSCRLDYELHTRDDGFAVEAGSVRIPPGGMVFFDGDRLRHRITPLGDGETRVSLTFEYVTDPRMRPWLRLLSNLKDAFGYFGFRQLLRGRPGGPAS